MQLKLVEQPIAPLRPLCSRTGERSKVSANMVSLGRKFFLHFYTGSKVRELNGFVKEQSKFHNYETEKITHKTSDAAEYI